MRDVAHPVPIGPVTLLHGRDFSLFARYADLLIGQLSLVPSSPRALLPASGKIFVAFLAAFESLASHKRAFLSGGGYVHETLTPDWAPTRMKMLPLPVSGALSWSQL